MTETAKGDAIDGVVRSTGTQRRGSSTSRDFAWAGRSTDVDRPFEVPVPVATGGDRERARVLAEQARDGWRAAGEKNAKEFADASHLRHDHGRRAVVLGHGAAGELGNGLVERLEPIPAAIPARGL